MIEVSQIVKRYGPNTVLNRATFHLPNKRTLQPMSWIYLGIAGVFEVAWAIGLKQSQGWTRLWPSVITGVLMIFSFAFLSLALKTLQLGTAYAVWTGIGAAGTAIVGIMFFGEPRDALRVLCIALIIGGVAGLKAVSRV
jgi:quaternary ammonium compound-resistance protein SugE